MLFGLPFYLWGLLGLAALPAIYFLTGKPLEREISALFLWQEEQRPDSRGTQVKPPLPPLILLLELMILILMILAAARPMWFHKQQALAVTLVLDDSYSMSAGPKNSPKSEALLAIKALAEDPRYEITDVVFQGLDARRYQPAKAELDLEELAERWSCRDSFADFSRTVDLVSQGQRPGLLIYISDHAAELPIAEDALWWQFGRPLDNTALLSGDRRLLGNEEQIEIEIGHFGSAEVEKTLQVGIVGQDREQVLGTVRLLPGQTRRFRFNRPISQGMLLITIEDDALSHDNQIYLPRWEQKPAAVHLAVADTEKALLERVLYAVGPVRYVAENEAELWIGPRLVPRETENRRLDLIWEQGLDDSLTNGPFYMADDGLFLGLSPLGLLWAGSAVTAARPDLEPLWFTDSRLILGRSLEHDSALFLFADPSRGNMLVSPAWPVFWSNLLDEVMASRSGLESPIVGAGQTVRFFEPGLERLPMRDPLDRSRVLLGDHGRFVHVPSMSGLYRLGDDPVHTVVVQGAQAAESDLRDASTGRFGRLPAPTQAAGVRSDAASWLLLLAVFALAFHWFWLRRSRRVL